MAQVRSDRLFAAGLLAFVVFLALCALVFSFCYSVYTIRNVKNQYKVDESSFLRAVDVAVSNYFDRVRGVDSSEVFSSEPVSLSAIEWRGVPGLATACLPSGRWVCVLDGQDYGVGDYCAYGLICRISSGRVYVSTASGYAVLRRGVDTPPADKNRPAAGDAADE